MLAPALGLLILAGYAFALWWLLRRERAVTFIGLALLCGLSLALRLVLTGGYPWGLFEDEPKFLGCALQALNTEAFAGESCIHIPYLLTALFEAQLVPFVGANRWAIRSYSMMTSVLATPAAFAAARSMRLRVAPALAVGGLVAVLPWSIFYGRIALGGELIFHQALLVAGLARLIWMLSGAVETLIAGFGLCLLLWDYWAGRAMMAMPPVAAVLATGWRRLWCLAVILIALIGWYPHLHTGPLDAHVGLSLRGARGAPLAGAFHPGFATAPVETFIARAERALRTLTEPIAEEAVFTMRSVAWHPYALLVLAALGLLSGVRRGLFLLAGFVAGVLPGMLSGTFGISAHRIMMSYLFIALGAGSAVNFPWRWLRRPAAAALFAAAAAWSIPLYFSDRFWPPEWRWNDNAEVTAIAEAVAENPPSRLIFMHQLGFWGFVTSVTSGAEYLSLDNWLPPDRQAVTYLFMSQAELLRPQYEHLFPGRVRPVGRASFLVSFEAADWSWVRRYGWTYTARCGDAAASGQVPFLFNAQIGLENFPCEGAITYEWRAHWHGPETDMTLYFSGRAAIEARGLSVNREGFEQTLAFRMPADTDVSISVTGFPQSALIALLREVSAGGSRAPGWERFTPLPAGQPLNLGVAAAPDANPAGIAAPNPADQPPS